MEKYTMVKTEVQPNGDIFLFYVDENGATEEEGIVTTIENSDQSQLEEFQENYILAEVPIETETTNIESLPEDTYMNADNWTDAEIKKLLVFYIDNKEAFQNYATKQISPLWTIACKAMLTSKLPDDCDKAFLKLKKKYAQLLLQKNRGVDVKSWAYYDLCHQAFQDDPYVKSILKQHGVNQEENLLVPMGYTRQVHDGFVSIKKVQNKMADDKVKEMLELYLGYKKEPFKDFSWHKHVWDKIAIQLGEDGDYWHKRFLNFKQHYIRMLEKRNAEGTGAIVWPYMKIFDEIYEKDEDFKRKYNVGTDVVATPNVIAKPVDWDETEKTVLVKYCYDCYDEFQDPTIPNSFLWNEVGRLLDRSADSCKKKYEELKTNHLNLYLAGGYNLRLRKPVSILFDNIISKEVEMKLTTHFTYSNNQWSTENIDTLVQFLFDSIEMFKDPICHFVCWAVIAHKLNESVHSCLNQWNDLTTLYKSILNDKKEDSDLQIDWRYIDLFDRIFDYGMDTKLLDGYEKTTEDNDAKDGVKKVNSKKEVTEDLSNTLSDDEDYDEKSSGKRSRGTADPKQIQILEYYFKNKDKFATSQRRKQVLWDVLAKHIGLTAEQCAHRFRNLKQVYTAYIQREINKPEMPILWPYYALCKKVFGYRAIKNKLKNGKVESDEGEEWSTKQIRALINHFGKNLADIESDTDDTKKWTDVAKEIQKSITSCRDKFLELRKSYRKIKTMRSKNPGCKVNWKYFKMFEDIYTGNVNMEVENNAEQYMTIELPPNAIKTEITEDEDFQCIIVIPEGEEISNLNSDSNQIIVQQEQPNPPSNEPKVYPKWTKEDKKELLTHYLEYLLKHQGKVIDIQEMWTEIVNNHFPNRSRISCKKMYTLLKIRYKKLVDKNNQETIAKSSCYNIMKKILDLKPKFLKAQYSADDMFLQEGIPVTDVSLPIWKVDKALKYYLQHLEEFVHPKYDKKHVWIGLAKTVSVPVSKLFKKINYLKQNFNSETNEVNGEKVEFADTMREILEKENLCKSAIGNAPEPMETDEEVEWKEETVEQLLTWYLENLDKFKNPKYVPSYLWTEASNVLNKSALACSKKMTEIRKQYSSMVKENPDDLSNWRFSDLCQKIYGTGKKSCSSD